MDNSVTRRGQPCWFRKEAVGMKAINDSFILESFVYRLLRKYFRTELYYTNLVDLVQEVCSVSLLSSFARFLRRMMMYFEQTVYQTELGQLQDLLSDGIPYEKFTLEMLCTPFMYLLISRRSLLLCSYLDSFVTCAGTGTLSSTRHRFIPSTCQLLWVCLVRHSEFTSLDVLCCCCEGLHFLPL